MIARQVRRGAAGVWVALGLMLGAGAALAAPSVRVQAQAEVRGPVIRLGDVAKLSGFDADARKRAAAIELGRSPAAGLGQLLPRAWLEGRLRDAGLGREVKLRLPTRLEVTRSAEKLPGARVSQLVEAAVRRGMPHPPGHVAGIQIPRIADLRVPAGSKVSVGFRPGEPFGEYISAEVRVTDGGEPVLTRTVQVKLDVFAEGYAVSTARPAGARLDRGDLQPVRLPSSQMARDAITDMAELEGGRLRRAVAPGEPIRRGWIEVPPLVERGERVRLSARRGGLVITAVGESLGAARRGDMVRVRNLSSQKVITGRAVAPGHVELEF